MSDIKDILGLPKGAPAAPAPRPAKMTIKKPDGMSREVFALLHTDSSTALPLPLVPAASPRDGFKEKNTRLIGWEWKQFTNGARTDGLQLSHWVKNNDKSASYSFARFNKVIKLLSYTDEEYAQYLTHPSWTKEASDALFDLCRRFDLRWPVIHDRFPGEHTLEQLKERFYDMCRMLLSGRLASAEPTAAAELNEHPLFRFRFDARHERERKTEFERLYARSAQEVQEELRQLEQAKLLEAKLKAQKKALKPGGRAASLAALRAALSASGMDSGTELAVSGLPSLAGLLEPPKKHRSSGVWLRSKDVSVKRPASEKQFSQFDQRLRELSLPQRVIPTEANVQLYNHCRANVVLLVELESKLKRLEYERNHLQQRKHQTPGGSAGGAASSLPAAGTSHGSSYGKRARSSQDGHAAGQGKRAHH